jgi:hypothetical protein
MQKIIREYVAGAMLLTALLISGCRTAPVERPAASLPLPAGIAPSPDAPFAAFDHARRGGQEVLTIVAEQSLVAITVRRGGTLARLGHDHVVAARSLEGYVAPALGKAALRFRLEEMTVDEAGLRAEAGLPPPPSADAIFATRRNMLERVLDAGKYPWLELHAEQVPGNASLLNADITLHGATRRYSVPVTIERAGGVFHVTGAFTVKQSDFGIQPFSVLGGALAVEDPVELRFDISAR